MYPNAYGYAGNPMGGPPYPTGGYFGAPGTYPYAPYPPPGYVMAGPGQGLFNTIKVGPESHMFPDTQASREKQRKAQEYNTQEAKLKRRKEAEKQKEEARKNMKTIGLQYDHEAEKRRRAEERRKKQPPPFDFSKIGIAAGGTGFVPNYYSQSPYPYAAPVGQSSQPSLNPVAIPPLDEADGGRLQPSKPSRDLLSGTYKLWKVYTLLKFWETHQTKCKAALRNQYFAEYYKKDGNAFLDQSIEMIKVRIRLILAEVLQDDRLEPVGK